MIFLRRARHVASIVTLTVCIGACSAPSQQINEQNQASGSTGNQTQGPENISSTSIRAVEVATASSQNSTGSKPSNQPSDQYAWVVAISAVVQALAALAVVGFTYWLAMLNKGLLKATKDTASAAKQSAKTATLALELIECADIRFEGPIYKTDGQATDDLTGETILTLRFRNFGRTAALNAGIGVTVAVPFESTPGPPWHITKHHGPVQEFRTIGPGASVDWFLKEPIKTISGADPFEDIVWGRKRLFYAADVAYNDIFGKAHWLRISATYRSHVVEFEDLGNNTAQEIRVGRFVLDEETTGREETEAQST